MGSGAFRQCVSGVVGPGGHWAIESLGHCCGSLGHSIGSLDHWIIGSLGHHKVDVTPHAAVAAVAVPHDQVRGRLHLLGCGLGLGLGVGVKMRAGLGLGVGVKMRARARARVGVRVRVRGRLHLEAHVAAVAATTVQGALLHSIAIVSRAILSKAIISIAIVSRAVHRALLHLGRQVTGGGGGGSGHRRPHIPLPALLRACVEIKARQASVSMAPSRLDLSMPAAAPRSGQPRPASLLGRAGRPHRACF